MRFATPDVEWMNVFARAPKEFRFQFLARRVTVRDGVENLAMKSVT
jgi:hypothetical protein